MDSKFAKNAFGLSTTGYKTTTATAAVMQQNLVIKVDYCREGQNVAENKKQIFTSDWICCCGALREI